MLHLFAMFFAHRAAAFAGLEAGPQLCARQLEVCPGKTRYDARSREANVRAVVAITNAWHQLGDILLRETRICAGIACFPAGITGGDAFDQDRVIG